MQLDPAETRGGTDPAPAGRGLRGLLRSILAGLSFHKRAVLVAFLLPVLLGVFAGLRAKPAYVAQARLLVLYTGDYVFHAGNRGTGNDIALDRNQVIQAELQILQSPALAGQVLAVLGPARVYPGADGPDAVRQAVSRMASDLNVTSIPQSNVIDLTLRNASRDVAIETLGALISRYVPYRSAIFDKVRSQGADAEQAQFAARLQQAEEALARFGVRHGISNLDEQTTMMLRQRNDNGNEQSNIAQQLAEAQARLVAVQKQLPTVPPTVQIYAESTRSQQVSGLTDSLVKLNTQRRELLSRYADDYPLVRDNERQIATVRSQISSSAPRDDSSTRMGRNPLYDDLRNQDTSLTVQLRGLQARQTTLVEQAERIQVRNNELVELSQEYRELKRTRDVLEQSLRTIAQSTEETTLANALERASGANVRVVQPPDASLAGTSQRNVMFLGGVLLGLLAAAATLAVLLALSRVALSADDAERQLGLPVLLTAPFRLPGKGEPGSSRAGLGAGVPAMTRSEPA